MSSDPPPPYPGGPSAPLLEEKDGFPFPTGRSPPAMVQPPSDVGPPPYEAMPPPQPGFIPPPVAAESSMPYFPPGGYYVPLGPHASTSYHHPPADPYAPAGGQTATVLVPLGTATTVTVLQNEIFQAAPVPTVCPHCQQAITTKITHEIGLMNFLLGLFCCFIGCNMGCCFIPCLIDEFKDVTHTCPNCKAYIYTYKRRQGAAFAWLGPPSMGGRGLHPQWRLGTNQQGGGKEQNLYQPIPLSPGTDAYNRPLPCSFLTRSRCPEHI
uniref:Cell death-inducing p53-target protein 1 n=1 Tax=Laticauda laticaudata TaxID=8630 RepID=A0A8C5S4I8_LATLA